MIATTGWRRAAGLAAVLALLLAGAGCESGPRETGAADADATDEYYEQLYNAYITDGDRSEAAVGAYYCAGARAEIDYQLRVLGKDGKRELRGCDAEEVRVSLRQQLKKEDFQLVRALWVACPSGGDIGVRFYPWTISDGTELWTTDAVCSVHTPEAYEEYLSELRDAE